MHQPLGLGGPDVPITQHMLLATLLVSAWRCVSGAAIVPQHDYPPAPMPVSELIIRPRVSDYRNEHVVLADCHDASQKYSSLMAYFPDAVTNVPQDTAVVSAPEGQTALWPNSVTKGLFTTTGTTFTATLGPRVNDGDYAGTGDNGYSNGGFRCWETFVASAFTYGNLTCNQVYDCNHKAAPTASPSPISTNTSRELSVGAVAGIAVGASAGALLILAGGVFYYLRRRARRRAAESGEVRQLETPSRKGILSLFRSPKPQPPTSGASLGEGSNNWPNTPYTEAVSPLTPKQEVQELFSSNNYTYELDAGSQPSEMPVQDTEEGAAAAAGSGKAAKAVLAERTRTRTPDPADEISTVEGIEHDQPPAYETRAQDREHH